MKKIIKNKKAVIAMESLLDKLLWFALFVILIIAIYFLYNRLIA
jgi:hypothetical protein